MGHPFLIQKNTYYYFVIWAVIAAAHVAFLIRILGVPIEVALLDGALFNAMLALAGLSYWYVVEYGGGRSRGNLSLFTRHFFGGTLIVLMSYGISTWVSELYFGKGTVTDLMVSMKVILGLFCFLILVLLYYLEKYNRDLRERSFATARADTERKQAELMLLKNQINPHFIFNSLNSISALTIKRPEDARQMIIKLSDFLRYSLRQDQQALSTFGEELSNIGLYIDIERVRFQERLGYQQEVAENTGHWPMPSMILQPLIENAIKHGLYESMETIHIDLSARMEVQGLRVTISNEFDPEAVPQKGRGIGLSNVENRLKLTYNENKLMSIVKTENLFTVSVLFPPTVS